MAGEEEKKDNKKLVYTILAAGAVVFALMIVGLVLFIAVLFYIGLMNPRNVTPTTCNFPPGISCSSYGLQPDGTLMLAIGQATGHAISVKAVSCTKKSTAGEWDVMDPAVQVGNGEQGMLGPVTCTQSDGTTAATGMAGETARFRIYVNYTETDTGMDRQVVGDMTVRYEN